MIAGMVTLIIQCCKSVNFVVPFVSHNKTKSTKLCEGKQIVLTCDPTLNYFWLQLTNMLVSTKHTL